MREVWEGLGGGGESGRVGRGARRGAIWGVHDP